MSKEITVLNGELGNIGNVTAIATQLKQLIVENQLFTNVKGNNYIYTDGWQIVGAFFGVTQRVTELVDLSDGLKYKYRAVVELFDVKSGHVVGRGIAICDNKESNKKSWDEYAIASMAQTRAIGKAYRGSFGWLMKLAGYETTPAEEMSEKYAESVTKTEASDEDKKSAFEEAKRRTQGV